MTHAHHLNYILVALNVKANSAAINPTCASEIGRRFLRYVVMHDGSIYNPITQSESLMVPLAPHIVV